MEIDIYFLWRNIEEFDEEYFFLWHFAKKVQFYFINFIFKFKKLFSSYILEIFMARLLLRQNKCYGVAAVISPNFSYKKSINLTSFSSCWRSEKKETKNKISLCLADISKISTFEQQRQMVCKQNSYKQFMLFIFIFLVFEILFINQTIFYLQIIAQVCCLLLMAGHTVVGSEAKSLRIVCEIF